MNKRRMKNLLFTSSLIPHPSSLKLWRRRVGIEPTRACSHSLTDGFEDRAIHQNRCASVEEPESQTLRAVSDSCQEMTAQDS